MNQYLQRSAESHIRQLADQFPAVAIVGPRQVGKTSLAQYLAGQWPREIVYLDLENTADLNKLNDPQQYLEPLKDKTVILDEVQRVPNLFPLLRGLIDRHRMPGRFILLGSASPELVRDASESLAGRIAYFELSPLLLHEVNHIVGYQTHWIRGGFPDSLLDTNDERSMRWRDNFIQTYLERDLPMLGLNANPLLTRRLWTMLAHSNGNLLHLEGLGNSLGITAPTVRRYLDFFEASYLVRSLQPWFTNIGKRIVKKPKIYLRDTGVLHALLAIGDYDALHGHPVLGASWEAYIVQQVAGMLPPRHELFFYRTQDGTEADLVVVKAGLPKTLVEIKYNSAPTITKSMRLAANDLGTQRNIIVAPVGESYPLKDGFKVVCLADLANIFD
ncbi:MAG: ATP-binding protein [Saprospiraceae bacterium]